MYFVAIYASKHYGHTTYSKRKSTLIVAS